MTEAHQIRSAGLSAAVAAAGAELVSLKDASGEELLWQAGPEWPRHAPVLFPTVGRLAGDVLRHGGKTYRMTQHGFARDHAFDWTERSETRAALTLSDGAETREIYPFAFRLDVAFEAEAATLRVVSTVTNPGAEILPFCIGAHPGFRWPLVDGVAKDDHAIEFEAPEAGPRRTVEGGLLGPEAPLPFDGRTLRLRQSLFDHDALVMPHAASRSVRYVAKGFGGEDRRVLEVAWRGYDDLGIWSAPSGAPFLCIEPWRGMASSVGWDGPFMEKPGVVRLAPGESMDFEWRVSV